MKSVIRWCCVAIFAAGLGAGEAGPLDYEFTENVFLTVRLHDIQRAVQRYQASPYAAFLATKSGQVALGQINVGLAAATDGQQQLLAEVGKSLQSAGLSLAIDPANIDAGPKVQAALACADAAKLLAAIGQFGGEGALEPIDGATVPSWRVDGSRDTVLEQHGNLLVFAAKDRGEVVVEKAAAPASPVDPDVDLEVVLDLLPLMSGILTDPNAVATLPPDAKQVMEQVKDLKLVLGARFADVGIEEELTYALPTLMADLDLTEMAKLDQKVFETLPPGTLWAMAWVSDAALTDKVLAKMPEGLMAQVIAPIDMALMQLGLPKYFDLVKAMDGQGMMYLELVEGKPAFTLVQGAKAEVAQQIVKVAEPHIAEANAEPCPEEVAKVLGWEPKMALAYVDGELIFTVHPKGIDGVTQRAGGFAQVPAVQAALAKLPAEAVALGVSNSPESWRFVGDMILKIMAQDESSAPMAAMLVTLPDDLAAVAKHGYMYVEFETDGSIRMRGAGVLTPVSTYTVGVGAAVGAVFWFMRPMMAPAQPPVAPPGQPPPPPPAF